MSTTKTKSKKGLTDHRVILQRLQDLEAQALQDYSRPEADEPDAKGAFIIKERAEAKLEVIRHLQCLLEGT